MAKRKTTELTTITAAALADGDWFPVVDVSDTTMSSTGTNKKIAKSELAGMFQPLDSDLTAIAALSTTSYGRAFLALADAAAGRTALGVDYPTIAADSALTSRFGPGEFPAVAYGSGNNAARINAAIAAAETAGGGTVVLDAQAFTLEATVAIPSNVRLRGAGQGRTTLTAGGALGTSSVLVSMVGSRSGIEAMTLIGNGATDQQAIKCYSVSTADTCSDNEITNMEIYGAKWGVLVGSARRISITDSYIHDSGGHNIELNDSNYCLVSRNRIITSVGGGVELYATTLGRMVGNTISDNFISAAGENGIQGYSDIQSVYSNNTITGSALSGILCNNASGQPSQVSQSHTIVGNTIVSSNASTTTGNGITLSGGTRDCLVSANVVKTVSGPGTVVSGCSGVVVAGPRNVLANNTIDSTWNFGVFIDSTSPHTVFTGNVIKDASRKAQDYAAGLVIQASNVTAVGNRILDSSGTYASTQMSAAIQISASLAGLVIVGNHGMAGHTTGLFIYNLGTVGSTIHSNLDGPMVLSGSGSPESVVTANIGSLYLRTNGGASTTLYVKESGTGNTGWVAK